MTELFLRVMATGVPVGLLAGLVMLAVPMLEKRYPARWRCRVWMALAGVLVLAVLPLGALVPPPVTLTVPPEATKAISFAQDVPEEPAAEEQETSKSTARAEAAEYGFALTVPGTGTFPAQNTEKVSVNTPMLRPTPLQLAAALWLAGAVGSGLWQLAAWWSWKRRVWRWLAPVDDELRTLVQQAASEHNVSAPRALCGPQVTSPMLVGVLRPVLLLPRDLPPQEQLLMVLRHEMTHLRRGDLWTKLLLMTARTLHWYHPLVWAMVRRAQKDIELACDEQVTGGKPMAWRSRYCQALLGAVHAAGTAAPPLSTQFAIGKEELMNRFAHVMKGWPARRGLPALFALMLTALLCCCGVGLTAGSEAAPTPTPTPPQRDYGPYPIANWDMRLSVVRTSEAAPDAAMTPEQMHIRVVNDSEVVWEGDGNSQVRVLRNWQDGSPDLFYVTETRYTETGPQTLFELYDTDGSLLMGLQGAAPQLVTGRKVMLMRYEGVDESVTGDCFLDVDTGEVSHTGLKGVWEFADWRYLIYDDRTELVDAELNVLQSYPDVDYVESETRIHLETYAQQLMERKWNGTYTVKMADAADMEAGVLLCDAEGVPVCDLPLMRVLNDGYALFYEVKGDEDRFRLLNVYTGEVTETDGTRRYSYFSDTVKLYQDDALVWGEWYLECPTGVYSAARVGRVGDGFWYMEWPAENGGEPSAADYVGTLHVLNAQGVEVFCGEQAEMYMSDFGTGEPPTYLHYRRVLAENEYKDYLVDEHGAAVGFGGVIRTCDALADEGRFIAQEGAGGRYRLCSAAGEILLEADDMVYDAQSGALVCLDGDTLGLRSSDGVWLWKIDAGATTALMDQGV
ncbi:MAG: M56 family metallopeptidase [Oscillospiraceae bacterium]|nr:M56 family metallopeptidase [Oscillospiraceae bacterium]